MKGKNVIFMQGLFAGILLCIVVSSAYLYLPGLLKEKHPEISFEQALTQIKNNQASEITIRQNVLEINDNNKGLLTVRTSVGDEIEERIFEAAKNTSTKINIEPVSEFSWWHILINPSVLVVIFGSLIIFTVIYLNHLNNKVEK